jgi:tRNA/rRNA methyltransferase
MRIILVEPLYDINIGKICRIMKNFGHTELYIVNPIAKLKLDARKYALHAKDILENAKIVNSFEEAIEGCYPIIGTTATPEKAKKELNNIIPLSEMNWLTKKDLEKAALVFGREDNGLTSELLLKCNNSVFIETTKEYPSMNLSNSVGVILYHFRTNERKYKKEKINSKLIKSLEKEFNLVVDSVKLKNPKKCKKAFSNLINKKIEEEELNSIFCVIKEINKKRK